MMLDRGSAVTNLSLVLLSTKIFVFFQVYFVLGFTNLL